MTAQAELRTELAALRCDLAQLRWMATIQLALTAVVAVRILLA